ncbi:hypothetical protein E3N88_21234 [Mikania micrantha]|uniref:Uncharacterized protein n=1 Tax=Mikania micrantha TaxID=192012 RepID=A0A5N6NJA1_9ASTR|nr:hypothetical protein E3N88_21234 [Mikania micrantha]
MSSRRNTPFSLPKPPPLDVPEASLPPLENRPPPLENIPLANPPPIPPPPQNPLVPPPPQNPPSIEEWDEDGHDVFWNWAFDNLFPPSEYLIENEEPEDEYVSNDPWAIDDNIDEETLNRLRNHDPWEDERNTDSDISECTRHYFLVYARHYSAVPVYQKSPLARATHYSLSFFVRSRHS